MPGKPDNRPGDYCLKQSSKVVNCGSYCTGGVCRHARPHIELARPAKAEPCGMVISEAMAARVPVAVSDACGAAAQLDRTDAIPAFVRGWDAVAREYENIYAHLA